MPIDGSYGRLSAHRQRFHELRRKKLERREKKLLRNSLNTIDRQGEKGKKESIDPESLELLKIKIRKRAKLQLRNELILIIASIIIGFIFIYFMYTNMID